MPRVTLPSGNTVDLKEPDDFMAGELFAIHRAVKMRQSAGGDVEFSNQEMADDRINAFLASAVMAWSFPVPVPAQNDIAAADVIIGKTMRAKDWAALRKAAIPLLDELEGEGKPDPKSGGAAADEGVPVPEQPAS